MSEHRLLDAVRGAGVLDVLRVFCGPDGRHGNRLAIVRDGSAVSLPAERQEMAARLGFGETVFVDDPERGTIDIYTPTVRLPFAVHPCVGAAWLLDLPELVTSAGVVGARADGEFSWIEARPEWAFGAPPLRPEHAGSTLHTCPSAADVDALPVPEPPPAPRAGGWVYAWAWEDEPAGLVRARGFAGRAGDALHGEDTAYEEHEATGTAALLLTAELGRALNIRQGRGSQILTAPGPEGWIEMGGRVVLERPGAAPSHAP
ncbi:PhzF family phenazine biosynthesis protein [Streptomyces sp. TS71-3]|uniref:PhzF family phenazine biosynthesis protein n=1 Tax=Streptomyces sp. TS71-3 TaxID=2733862 RepID=UPI001AFE1651|nr:PhzF family phenazine biosynthesis protein [Streptomyces sp. TS71-3]GHJ38048.1 hypothetical protein Sm713_36570 [Streptomyces sp. TS71-3]